MNSGRAPTQAEFHQAIAARSDVWYSACLKITRDPDMAADAVQDALLSAWNKRHQFHGDARLETWVHRIAINAALTLVRKHKPGLFEAFEHDVADSGDQPEQTFADHELENSLSRSLAQLSEFERLCFVLKHLEQWRAREVAEHLEVKEGQVKQAVFRAVHKLRSSMQTLQREAHG